MNSTVLEKIKKLLSLANSDNQNERDLALAKAQRIAVENQIDLALVDLSDVGVIKEEALAEDEVFVGKQLAVQKKFVAKIVRDACSVEILYGRNQNPATQVWENTICFLGKVSDVAFAKWLYPYLLDEYVRRWNYERKAFNLPATHRNTFYLGVYDGQRQKLLDERHKARNETIARHAQVAVAATLAATTAGIDDGAKLADKTTELNQKYGLVLVNEEKKRKNFLKEKYPRTTNMRSRAVSICSHDTYSSGTAHGRLIGLSRPLTA